MIIYLTGDPLEGEQQRDKKEDELSHNPIIGYLGSLREYSF